MKKRLIVLVCAALAYATLFQPSWWLRNRVRAAFGNPAYAGPWAAVEHLFLYSTLCTLVCALVWSVLARRGLMPPIAKALARGRGVWRWGVIGGFLALAPAVGITAVIAPKMIGWIPPKGWLIVGNLFSNFYEEFIHRGFLLSALEVAFGSFWPAAIVSSLAFGAEHVQYPLALRAIIAASGLLWCWTRRRTGTLWTPYLSHELVDLIGDCLVR